MESHEKVGGITNRSVFISKVDACQCSTSPALFRGVVIPQYIVLSKRRAKQRRSLTARKWRRKLCKLAAVLQGVETEKNAHACPEQRCFLRCNYFSVWSNWERATLVQEP